jgi:hypothetical protein
MAGEEEIVAKAAAEDVMSMAGIEGVVASFSNQEIAIPSALK